MLVQDNHLAPVKSHTEGPKSGTLVTYPLKTRKKSLVREARERRRRRRQQKKYNNLNSSTSNQLMILKKGDYFGERALLTSEVRSATVRADTQLVVLELTREDFDALGLREDGSWMGWSGCMM